MTIKIASRSSKLALAQVDEFVKQFAISDYEIVKIKTEGDKKSAKGETLFDKAHFVSDIQKYILNGEADIAVHSAKDTPAKELDSLLRYFLPSKPKEDLLIFREETNFNEEMILGTSSLRRQLQAKHHLNAKNIVNLSGNVDTRLEKLHRGEYDCIILAKAGLERLGLLDELSYQEMTWSTASGCAYVEELKVIGGGHDWPGSFGNMTIDANIEIWQFVSRYDINGLIGCITTSINENNGQNDNKQLIKIVDILGRESKEKRNTPLFYIYDDGKVEKKITLE